MVLSTKFRLMNTLYVLVIGFLFARKCVTDMYDDVKDVHFFAYAVKYIQILIS